jgi:hypothetical protein
VLPPTPSGTDEVGVFGAAPRGASTGRDACATREPESLRHATRGLQLPRDERRYGSDLKPVREPDAVAPHVRFDERGWETGRWPLASATAPILDSTFRDIPQLEKHAYFRNQSGRSHQVKAVR